MNFNKDIHDKLKQLRADYAPPLNRNLFGTVKTLSMTSFLPACVIENFFKSVRVGDEYGTFFPRYASRKTALFDFIRIGTWFVAAHVLKLVRQWKLYREESVSAKIAMWNRTMYDFKVYDQITDGEFSRWAYCYVGHYAEENIATLPHMFHFDDDGHDFNTLDLSNLTFATSVLCRNAETRETYRSVTNNHLLVNHSRQFGRPFICQISLFCQCFSLVVSLIMLCERDEFESHVPVMEMLIIALSDMIFFSSVPHLDVVGHMAKVGPVQDMFHFNANGFSFLHDQMKYHMTMCAYVTIILDIRIKDVYQLVSRFYTGTSLATETMMYGCLWPQIFQVEFCDIADALRINLANGTFCKDNFSAISVGTYENVDELSVEPNTVMLFNVVDCNVAGSVFRHGTLVSLYDIFYHKQSSKIFNRAGTRFTNGSFLLHNIPADNAIGVGEYFVDRDFEFFIRLVNASFSAGFQTYRESLSLKKPLVFPNWLLPVRNEVRLNHLYHRAMVVKYPGKFIDAVMYFDAVCPKEKANANQIAFSAFNNLHMEAIKLTYYVQLHDALHSGNTFIDIYSKPFWVDEEDGLCLSEPQALSLDYIMRLL